MALLDAPSPTPSAMPPPNNKRPRVSNNPNSAATGGAGGLSSAGGAAGAGPSRAKRRKPEGSVDPDGSTGSGDLGGRGRGAGGGGGAGREPVNFGVGMVKGREEEWGEPADVVTKIDFNTLPVETLYKYLEYHDLLPRWDATPWSEDPCTPPNALYTLPPPPPSIPIVPIPAAAGQSPTPASPKGTDDLPPPTIDPSGSGMTDQIPIETVVAPSETAPVAVSAPENTVPISDPTAEPRPTEEGTEHSVGETDEPMEEETPAPPTTRSKTAPQRRPPTPPPPSPPPLPEIKRGVITLSDVYAARAVLAEKANAHWVKGLGGGQNKEGETIVNFLYKMKAGPNRLLRVYNPWPAPWP